MDPCSFLRVVINNLAIKFPSDSSPPSYYSYFCIIKLTHLPFSSQSAAIPLLTSDAPHPDPHTLSGSICFTLTGADIQRLVADQRSSKKPSKRLAVQIDVYSRKGVGCGFGSKFLGRVSVPLEISEQTADGKGTTVMRNGWVEVGERKRDGQKKNPEVYLTVKANPDPRFGFEFGSEPECSPQVFQVQGSVKQPVFSCKFSFRNYSADLRESNSIEKDHHHHDYNHRHNHNHSKKERKGWSVTIHDLSGSPVAVASMVTPFVPSNGSGRVSRSNPGAWLILRPGGPRTWMPWGRLEAWHEKADRVGYQFELFHESGPATVMGPEGITLAQSTISSGSGGKFSIDITSAPSTPAISPNSSLDFDSKSRSRPASWSGSESEWWAGMMYKGFVMSSTVGGGRPPAVEVGSQHVTCTEDAAVFVALAAAVDLSIDACRPFSQKLRKELRQPSGELVV